jgi:hypothetical protein
MNWKIALVASTVAALAGVFGAMGCGGDDCTLADDHMAECAAATASSSSSSSSGEPTAQVCSGARLCYSQCINQHTCQQINGNDTGFIACLTRCKGK